MRRSALALAAFGAAVSIAIPAAASASPTGAGSTADPVAGTASTGTDSNPLNARAAAHASGLIGDGIGIQASWYSGTVSAGGTQSWVWNNATSDAYQVGFSPAGASTSATCQFEATRTWYVQQPTGEREFHFTIENVGSIACGTTILLAGLDDFTTWSTGGVDPGATQHWQWNNATPLNSSHLVGLTPTGATGSTACQFEVTRSWYVQQPTGEREFHFYVKNVGTIACTATIRLGLVTTSTSWSTGSLAPGSSGTWHWNNANPLNLVYLPGLSPLGGGYTCQLEVTRGWYLQRINTDGSAEREFYFTVKNVGANTCSGTILLGAIAA